ncbi:MAG: arylamine N-acetyltransferase [bacterium]|nr:arylamine N-acetyltransferase [bacterium]
MSQEQLADYRDRIDWHCEARPDRATLEELVERHTRTIAFENIDRLTDKLLDLSLDAVVTKLVRGKRGGVCYEQAALFKAVLETVGFEVVGLMARVKWNVPEGHVNGRSHMALRVDLAEGPVIVDVGFCGQTLTGVLDLVSDVEQSTPHGPYRLVREREVWQQEALVLGKWRPIFIFDLQPQLPIDYEIVNWWSATNPKSQFRKMLVVSRSTPGRRTMLHNFDLTTHFIDGPSEHRRLGSAAEVCDIVEQLFDIRIPDRAKLASRLDEVSGLPEGS